MRLESFDLSRQLDRWEQLGALCDNRRDGLGLLRREAASANVVEQVGMARAQSSGVFSGRMWNETGAPRREGMTRSIRRCPAQPASSTEANSSARLANGRLRDVVSGHSTNLPTRRNDLPLPHSITSSARPSSGRGKVRPSALAVFRLRTSSNLVGCTTGNSLGLAPWRIG